MINEELNNIYFPNGMPLILKDKKKECFEHIEHINRKFRELEEKLKEGGEVDG
jgi:hypothetical protein